MTGEKGILHMSISNRSSSLTQKSSLGRKRNSWNCWGLLNARQTAVLMHQRSDVLVRRWSGEGDSTPAALVMQYPCSCGQAAVPRATRDSAHGNVGALPWV